MPNKTITYNGNFVYEDGSLSYILNEEGQYVEKDGMRFNVLGSSTNKYLYNGKELQEETDWLDYGARMYQPELGKWFNMDPLGEQRDAFTPYSYCSQNPINRIDPNGMLDDWIRDLDTIMELWEYLMLIF